MDCAKLAAVPGFFGTQNLMLFNALCVCNASVLRHYWLGIRKSIRIVKKI